MANGQKGQILLVVSNTISSTTTDQASSGGVPSGAANYWCRPRPPFTSRSRAPGRTPRTRDTPRTRERDRRCPRVERERRALLSIGPRRRRWEKSQKPKNPKNQKHPQKATRGVTKATTQRPRHAHHSRTRHYAKNDLGLALTPGHELAGVVIAVGCNVPKVNVLAGPL